MIKKIKNYFAKKATEGSKIPYIIVIFFLVIITVNVIYVLIATNLWKGVAVENSYQKGIEYNETLKQKELQEKLGWVVDYQYEEASSDDGSYNAIFYFKVLQENGFPIKNANLIASFYRSDKPEFGVDKVAEYDPDSNKYIVKIFLSAKGNWDIEISIKKDDDLFKEKKKFFIE